MQKQYIHASYFFKSQFKSGVGEADPDNSNIVANQINFDLLPNGLANAAIFPSTRQSQTITKILCHHVVCDIWSKFLMAFDFMRFFDGLQLWL